RFGSRNGSFRLGELGVQLGFECLAALRRFRIEPKAGLVRDLLRAASRLGKRLLVSRKSDIGFALELLGLGEVAADAIMPRLKDCADLRQRDPRQDDVERREGNRQPEQLRRKSLLLERQK